MAPSRSLSLRLLLCGVLGTLVAGCEAPANITGTLADNAPGQEAGERASVDAMRALLKAGRQDR